MAVGSPGRKNLAVYDPPGVPFSKPALHPSTVCWIGWGLRAGVETLRDDLPVFLPCRSGRCKGGSDFSCVPGYKGKLCSECEQGQFYWQGRCDTKCADLGSEGAVTVFGIIGVILVWIILNKSAGGLYAATSRFKRVLIAYPMPHKLNLTLHLAGCLDVGLSYAQIMSTVFRSVANR